MLLFDIFAHFLQFLSFINFTTFFCSPLYSTTDYGVIDSYTPQYEPLSPKYKRSYAYVTVSRRMPKTLSQFAENLDDYVDIIVQQYGQKAQREVYTAIKEVSKLKQEIEGNYPISNLTSDGVDVNQWNSFLESYRQETGTEMYWLSSPWLTVECYMYRRLRHIFELSNHLRNFDHFGIQKQKYLNEALSACSELAKHLVKLSKNLDNLSNEDIKKEMFTFLQVNLWGNRFDMAHTSGSRTKPVNMLELVNQLQSNVLVQNSETMWDILADKSESNQIIDVVCDNAAFELFTDLCLADFLITFSFATKIRFHIKSIPWFVSDTMISDMKYTIDILKKSEAYDDLQELGNKWERYFSSGIWTLEESSFWTLPYPYNYMESVNPLLYNKLGESRIVIFKGDLNYRKLLGEINWPTTTTFETSLRKFKPNNIVALRTIKADVISGLTPGQAEHMESITDKWNTTGDYGVIQCYKKN